MKRIYIKPELLVMDIETSALVAVSLGADMSNDGRDDVVFESSKQRNKWGNLWE